MHPTRFVFERLLEHALRILVGHTGITVDDVHTACERFDKLGVEFVKRPTTKEKVTQCSIDVYGSICSLCAGDMRVLEDLKNKDNRLRFSPFMVVAGQ